MLAVRVAVLASAVPSFFVPVTISGTLKVSVKVPRGTTVIVESATVIHARLEGNN